MNGGKPGRVQSEPQVCFRLRWLRAQPHPKFLCKSCRLEEALRLRSDSLRKLRHPIGGLRRIVANPFQTGIEQEVDIPSRTLQTQGAGESGCEVPIRIPIVAIRLSVKSDASASAVCRESFGRIGIQTTTPRSRSFLNSSSRPRTTPCPYWHTVQVGEMRATARGTSRCRLNTARSCRTFAGSMASSSMSPAQRPGHHLAGWYP